MALDLEQLADDLVETDFLIVGGGLAGCMAALAAKQKGNVDVVIMEKAAIRHSGQIPFGIGTWSFIHPQSYEDLEGLTVKMIQMRYQGLVDGKHYVPALKNTVKAAALLEDAGMQFRESNGKYQAMVPPKEIMKMMAQAPVVPHFLPGARLMHRGGDIKMKLASSVRKNGVKVYERTILTGLLTKDGVIAGATGVNIRTGTFTVFKAKAVLIATGAAQRTYSYTHLPFPANLFWYTLDFPGNHGGGIAAAYRAGAKVANMEFMFVTSPSPLGGGAHAFRMFNSKGEDIQEKYQDMGTERKGGFFPYTAAIFAPDMLNPGILRDVITYRTDKSTRNQRTGAAQYSSACVPQYLKTMKLEGDWGKMPPMEARLMTQSLVRGFSGILTTQSTAETSIKNLFTAGDTSSGAGGDSPIGGAPSATAWGYTVGAHVGEILKDIKKPSFGAEQLTQAEKDKARALAPLGRKGVDPLQLENHVRKINNNYVGLYRTESRLQKARELFVQAKERFVPALGVENPHELMRAIEVQDIIDVSEMHAFSALTRKESRMIPGHFRVDYPEQDDANWQKSVVLQHIDGEMKVTLEKMT
jgi:succinate dehydrogenase/fumarate reductase flavoprotein subunit